MTTDKHYSSTCCLKVISHYVSAANDRWADRSGTVSVSVSVARGPELTAVRPAQTFSFSWTPAPCCAAAARHPIARVRLHHPGARVFRRLTLRRDRAPSLRSRPADTAFALRPAYAPSLGPGLCPASTAPLASTPEPPRALYNAPVPPLQPEPSPAPSGRGPQARARCRAAHPSLSSRRGSAQCPLSMSPPLASAGG